jgi:hypothetical protein
MKSLVLGTVILSSLICGCSAQPTPSEARAQMPFPKDSAQVNIKDSILIGKYFVAVKGYFFSNYLTENPTDARVYVKGFENTKEISLQNLKQNLKLVSSDSLRPVLNGNVALLKTNNATASTTYNINVHNLKELPKVDMLEEGDIIAFVGMMTFDGKRAYTFPATWYKVVK